MPKYRVLEKSYVGNAIREVGAVVDYDGKPGKSLELIAEADPKLSKKEAEAKAQAEAEAAAKAEAEAKAAAEAAEAEAKAKAKGKA